MAIFNCSKVIHNQHSKSWLGSLFYLCIMYTMQYWKQSKLMSDFKRKQILTQPGSPSIARGRTVFPEHHPHDSEYTVQGVSKMLHHFHTDCLETF